MAIKSFQYKTDEGKISNLKKLAIDKKVHAKDIIDIALTLFSIIDDDNCPNIELSIVKEQLDCMINERITKK